MRKTKIVTHNGKAHRDEYLSCCLIMYEAYRRGRLTFIERRMCGESDLNCPETWVVDTGGVWDASMLNFDHHQDSESVKGVCAFDLVAKEIFGSRAFDIFRICNPWVKLTALHDTEGGSAVSAHFGMESKVYAATRSPIEKAMLSAFGEMSVIHPESPLATCMRETGRIITAEAEEVFKGIPDRINTAPAPFLVAGIKVWDVRSAWGDNDYVSTAVVNHAASTRSVDLVVGKNHRTGGIGLYRTSWATDKLDLSFLKGCPGVNFIHKNGFYAVITNDVKDTDIINLIRKSVEGI